MASVFSTSAAAFCSRPLQVIRFFDCERNVLVYVAYSNRIIEGSPKNSISSVPITNWPGTQNSRILPTQQ